MRISVDISFYPLNEEYLIPIKNFIKEINKDPELQVETNKMSTQIRGEHERIFNLLSNEIANVFEKQRAAFVIKVIKGKD